MFLNVCDTFDGSTQKKNYSESRHIVIIIYLKYYNLKNFISPSWIIFKT